MPAIINRELGNIVIEDSVLANIAGISAMESYGIVGMASKNAADGIFELLRFENLSKGIVVNTDENEKIYIFVCGMCRTVLHILR